MELLEEVRLASIISMIVWSLLSIGIFGFAFVVIERLSPFSIRKEISEDHNVALGVIMGSMVIGLAIIVASIVRS